MLTALLSGWSGLGLAWGVTWASMGVGLRTGGVKRLSGFLTSPFISAGVTFATGVGLALAKPVMMSLGVAGGSLTQLGIGVATSIGAGYFTGKRVAKKKMEREKPQYGGGTKILGLSETEEIRQKYNKGVARAPGADVPVTLAGIPIGFKDKQGFFRDELEHFRVIGATGQRKTTAIYEMLDTAVARGDRLIVLDPNGSYSKRYLNKERGDVVLNFFDPRSVKWDLFKEIKNPYRDIPHLGRSFFPQMEGETGKWNDYAYKFFSVVTQKYWEKTEASPQQRNMQELYRLLVSADAADLKELLKNTDAEPYMAQGGERFFTSLRSVMSTNLESFQHIFRQQSQETVGIRDWVNSGKSAHQGGKGGVLFLTYHLDETAASSHTMSAWMNLAFSEALKQPEEKDQRLWFVFDELTAAGKIQGLKEGMKMLRKVGGRVILGFQSLSDVENTYGTKDSKTILENCRNTLILSCGGADPGGTADYASKTIGRTRIRQINESKTRHDTALVGSTTKSQQWNYEYLVSPSDVEQLGRGDGFLKTAGRPEWMQVQISSKYLHRSSLWDDLTSYASDHLSSLRGRFAMENSISAGRPTDTEQAPRDPVKDTASEQVTDQEEDQENRTKQSDRESGTSVAASGNKRPLWNRLVSYLPNLRRPQAATVIESTAADNTATVAKASEETPPAKSTEPEPTAVKQAVDDEKKVPVTITDKPPDPTPAPEISVSQETPKETAKETPQEVPKDTPQQAAPKEEERINPAPTAKVSVSQETSKETPKETAKETPKAPQQATPKEEERNGIAFFDPGDRTAAPPPPPAAPGNGADPGAKPKKRTDELDTTSVPYEFIKNHYRQKAGTNDYVGVNDGQFVFRDEGRTLWTKSEVLHVGETFTEFAKERKWKEITAKGSLEFRRNVWLQGSLRDIKVYGYEPTKEDIDRLEASRKGSTNTVELGKSPTAGPDNLQPPNPAEEKKDQTDNKAPPPQKDNDKKGEKEDEKKEEKKDGKTATGSAQPANAGGKGKSPAGDKNGPTEKTASGSATGEETAPHKLTPVRGKLVEQGWDAYPKNPTYNSFYIVLEQNGEKQPRIWGNDFSRALKHSLSGAKTDSEVVLLVTDVELIPNTKDDKGNPFMRKRGIIETQEFFDHHRETILNRSEPSDEFKLAVVNRLEDIKKNGKKPAENTDRFLKSFRLERNDIASWGWKEYLQPQAPAAATDAVKPAGDTTGKNPDQNNSDQKSPDKKGSKDFTALERREVVAKVREIRKETEQNGGAGRGKIVNYLSSKQVTWAMLNYWEAQIDQEDAAAAKARQAGVAAHQAEKSQQPAAAVKGPLAKSADHEMA